MRTHGSYLWTRATYRGWMTKHMPPAFSFTKTHNRRYIVLIDRMIYTYKTDDNPRDFREFFELSKNTDVFATDLFPSVLYCLEIQRNEDGRTWYLQADNVEEMKIWMDRLKRTVQWLRGNVGGEEDAALTLATLETIDPHDDLSSPKRSSLSLFPLQEQKHDSRPYWLAYTDQDFDVSMKRGHLPTVLPPQPPPPTSRPPPPPQTFTELS